MTCDEGRSWSLWGPCSGGGQDVLVQGARVFVVSYGDATPEGTEQRRELTPAEFARQYAADPRAAEAIAWLTARGLVPRPRD